MTTIAIADWTRSPEIIIGEEDKQKLTIAALTGMGHSAAEADYLLYELDRAMVLPDRHLPPNVVRIGSVVRYRSANGEERTVKLVMPADTGSGSYCISVTSELGAALLGLRPGQTISCPGSTGAARRIKVVSVVTLEEGGFDPGPGAA